MADQIVDLFGLASETVSDADLTQQAELELRNRAAILRFVAFARWPRQGEQGPFIFGEANRAVARKLLAIAKISAATAEAGQRAAVAEGEA